MNDVKGFEDLSFLLGSRVRVELLGALFDREEATARELRNELEASRSTVSRALRELERRGWVVTVGGRWQVSATGTLVGRAVRSSADSIGAVDELLPFLRWFPHESLDLDVSALLSADVATFDAADPYATTRRGRELASTADGIRALVPLLEMTGTEIVYERVTAGDLVATVIVSPPLESTLHAPEFAPLVAEMLRSPGYSLRVAEEEFPLYLGLPDDGPVQLGVVDDDRFPRAVAESSNDAVRAWAESTFDRYHDASRAIGPEEF